MVGEVLGHYRIERALGAGGMGAVYLATDLALGRPAALKVVADAQNPDLKARLLREADAGARLQHPAIATFYESGDSTAGAFIAMEYVRGRTLRDRLGDGRLPLETSLAITSTLLEALHHAHAAGILHRDIKPENIMLTEDGLPKLLDFGLARVLRPASADGATLTNLSAGQLLGTFGYMPPEQLHGQAVDERSDLFALGAVLYEMILGRAAFPGAHPAERIAAILGRDPSIAADAAVPPGIRSLISRSLARDPAARFPSAAAMLSELRGLISGDTPLPLPQSVAVVDLRNLSGQADNDWIGSGIAESLLIDLARLPGLTVIPREKVLRAARELGGGDPLDIGRTLGSRWVVSGSFQRAGAAVRITTTLADVTTGEIAAAEKLDGSMDAIFELQDRLSRAVASSLNLRLPSDAGRAGKDLAAFELHARGQRLWRRLEKGTFEQAGELYRRAVEIEPGYAPALSGLAALHAMRFTFTTDPQELERAAEYARRAIAADPRLADPHVWLGYALMRQDRFDEALTEQNRAAALDPAHAYAPYFSGSIELFRGRPAAAIPCYQRAVMIDPQHGFAWAGLSGAHVNVGSFEEGRWCIERAIALEGSPAGGVTAGARVYLAECLRLMGDLPAAREACLAGLADTERSDHMYRDSFRGTGLCVLGRIALDQGDDEAARVALHQVIAHVAGRDRTLGGGHLVVQALAGLARAGEGSAHLDEALSLFTTRERFNFSLLWTCADDVTLLELARGAAATSHPRAGDLLARARALGSIEARRRGAALLT